MKEIRRPGSSSFPLRSIPARNDRSRCAGDDAGGSSTHTVSSAAHSPARSCCIASRYARHAARCRRVIELVGKAHRRIGVQHDRRPQIRLLLVELDVNRFAIRPYAPPIQMTKLITRHIFAMLENSGEPAMRRLVHAGDNALDHLPRYRQLKLAHACGVFGRENSVTRDRRTALSDFGLYTPEWQARQSFSPVPVLLPSLLSPVGIGVVTMAGILIGPGQSDCWKVMPLWRRDDPTRHDCCRRVPPRHAGRRLRLR